MKLIELKNIFFSYNKTRHVLQNISLEVNAGDYIGIIGENGSGKSTLAQIICGRQKATKGEFNLNIKKTEISYIRQTNETNTLFPITAEEFLKFNKLDDDDKFLDFFLEQYKMKDLLSQQMSSLSGGERQRVYLIKALIKRPKLLILDEPTKGLDEASQNFLFSALRYFNKKFNVAILIIDHHFHKICHESNKTYEIQKTFLHSEVEHNHPTDCCSSNIKNREFGKMEIIQ